MMIVLEDARVEDTVEVVCSVLVESVDGMKLGAVMEDSTRVWNKGVLVASTQVVLLLVALVSDVETTWIDVAVDSKIADVELEITAELVVMLVLDVTTELGLTAELDVPEV